MTTLSSKLVATQKEYFGNMVVDAVSHLDERMAMNMIGIKKVHGGSLEVRFFFDFLLRALARFADPPSFTR